MYLTKKKKKKINSNSLEYEDGLYFDLQPKPHGMRPGVSSYGMEADPIWNMNAFWWLTDVI